MKNKPVVDESGFVRYMSAARSRAAAYLAEPVRLTALLSQARHKAERLQKEAANGPLKGFIEQVGLVSRLLIAYTHGEYRVIPWESVLMATAALVYFLMPFDALTDWLVGLGFIDDALVMAMAFKALKADLVAFADWERAQAARPEPDESPVDIQPPH